MKIRIPDVKVRPERPFFNRANGRSFCVKAQSDEAVIDLYDEIGVWGVTAKDFRSQLKDISASNIRVRINSPGGDVFDGIAIHNDLADHAARVRVEVTGLAASAASIVAMAGDEIAIADNAFFMIHNAWGVAVGNRHDMSDLSDILGQIDTALAKTYSARTGLDIDEVASLMDAETWFSGQDAVDEGFADEVTGAADVSARFDLSSFKNTPTDAPTLGRAKPDVTQRGVERALRDAGYSRSQAKELSSKVAPEDSLRDAGQSDGFTAALGQLHETMIRKRANA